MRQTALQRLCLLVPLLLGLYFSIGYVGTSHDPHGEQTNATVALLTKGVLADPYGFPTGPTAHVSPGHIGWIASVYWLFGINTPAARIALSLADTLLYCGTYLLAVGTCRSLRLGPAGIWTVCVLGCLVPMTLFDVVISYRTMDQPLSAFVLMLGIFLFFLYRNSVAGALRLSAVEGALAGAGSLVSPGVFPTLVVLALRHAWDAPNWRFRLTRAALSLGLAAAFILPWAICNEIELGAFIPFRSNFFLEFAVGNQDGADGITDDLPPGVAREMHPLGSPSVAAKVAAMGEVAYMHSVQQVALRQLATHKLRFIELCVIRVWYSFVPVGQTNSWMPVLHTSVWLLRAMVGILELASLGLIAFAGRGVLLWLCVAVLPLAPYFITHTDMRYTYLVYFPALCVIAVGADVVSRWWASRWQPLERR